jgi:hypothetical protein
MNANQLFFSDGTNWSTGSAKYYADYEYGPANLLVAIQFSIGRGLPSVHGLLDTASTWIVLSKDFLVSLDIEIDEDPSLKEKMLTRFGTITGYLNRIPIIIIAEEQDGSSLEVEATCFISEEWNGRPPVIGWRGCLERMKFAIDPSQDRFYFGGI